VVRRLRAAWHNWASRPPLGPYHAAAALGAFFAARGRPLLDGDAASADRDEAGAARFVLTLLARRPVLRRRFPRPLTGPDFPDWLDGPGGDALGLSPRARRHLRAVFAARPAERIRQMYDECPRLREAYPLALMPAGRESFLRWLLERGRPESGLTDEEIGWFAFEAAEDPYHGLAATYLLTPEWQEAVPHGLTRAGWPALRRWVRRRHDLPRRWLGRCPTPDQFSPAQEARLLRQAIPGAPPPGRIDRAEGVNVLAHFRSPSGVQEGAFNCVRALHEAGVPTSCRDIPAGMASDLPGRAGFLGLELFDTSLLFVAPEPLLDIYYPRAGLRRRPGVRRVAFWAWELEQVPAAWARHAEVIDEIWAPSRFTAEALARVVPVPTFAMSYGLELPPFDPLSRSHFGLPEGRFLFLFLFDMCSVMERKNPLGLIRAYRRAFGGDPRAALAIKVSRPAADPVEFARLKQAADEAGVLLLDRVVPRAEALALLDCCDCYVSLHRSEGFGLTLAEAMLLGKPVVTTAYSGNLDFMTADDSRLVGYELAPITQDLPFYPKGALWAEPSVEEAAGHLRWAFDHPEAARALGARARAAAGRRLSVPEVGRRMRQRLEETR
jgi:glycosyltransferase involved in cell wall biosynthesis